jgi:solute carrier family 32 (vesicular inhibitory amino acid transporter)
VTNRLAALTDLGGVNSIRSFTRSWQRAAGFVEVIPQRPSFVFAPDQAPLAMPAEALQYSRNDVNATHNPRTSLLRQHFEGAASIDNNSHPDGDPGSSSAIPQPDFRETERKYLDEETPNALYPPSPSSRRTSIFAIPPHLATPPIAGSYSSFRSYGTFQSDVSAASMVHAAAIWRPQQETAATMAGSDLQPILVKEVERDGKIVLAVEGQSTLPQTIFNSTK